MMSTARCSEPVFSDDMANSFVSYGRARRPCIFAQWPCEDSDALIRLEDDAPQCSGSLKQRGQLIVSALLLVERGSDVRCP